MGSAFSLARAGHQGTATVIIDRTFEYYRRAPWWNIRLVQHGPGSTGGDADSGVTSDPQYTTQCVGCPSGASSALVDETAGTNDTLGTNDPAHPNNGTTASPKPCNLGATSQDPDIDSTAPITKCLAIADVTGADGDVYRVYTYMKYGCQTADYDATHSYAVGAFVYMRSTQTYYMSSRGRNKGHTRREPVAVVDDHWRAEPLPRRLPSTKLITLRRAPAAGRRRPEHDGHGYPRGADDQLLLPVVRLRLLHLGRLPVSTVNAAAALLAFAPALAIGSFLNVVAARVPLQRVDRAARLGLHVLRDGDRLVRQRPAALVPRPARPLPRLRRSIGCATRPSSSSTALLVAGCVLRFGLTLRGGARGVLLRRPRRPLGDRPRAPDRPEPDRPPGRGGGARRADRCVDPSLEWLLGALGARSSSSSPRSPTRGDGDGRRQARAAARRRARQARSPSR